MLCQNRCKNFVEVSNRSSNDSFFDFVFERFGIGYHESLFKKRSFKKTDTLKKLSSIDPADKKNQKNPKHVDIGFAARGTSEIVTEKKAESELCVLSFKNHCNTFLFAIVIKLLERSPLKYSLVPSLMIVVSQKLVSDSAEAQVKLSDFCRFYSTESDVRQKLATKLVLSSKALY